MALHECVDQRLIAVVSDNNMVYYEPGDRQSFDAMFTFNWEFLVQEWVLPGDAVHEPEVCRWVPRYIGMATRIHLTHNELFDNDEFVRILKHHLQHWSLQPDELDEFIRNVQQRAFMAYAFMPLSHNTMFIHFPATIVHTYAYDERTRWAGRTYEHDERWAMAMDMDTAILDSQEEVTRLMVERWAMNTAILDSEEEVTSFMVPTAEFAINSLKDVDVSVVDSAEHCTICLEEIDGECQAKAMPCSHTFHGDCIKQWLRRSHYCPVCRFKMPTISSSG